MKKEWNHARSTDSITAYEAFLALESSGVYADSARMRRDELIGIEFQNARHQNTVGAYREFLDRFPDATVSVEARSLLQNLREELLLSYEAGITLEKSFLNDEWNVLDPVDGVIGIVGFRRNNGISEYDLGLYKAPKSTRSFLDKSRSGYFFVAQSDNGFTINRHAGRQLTGTEQKLRNLQQSGYTMILLTNSDIANNYFLKEIADLLDATINEARYRNAIWENHSANHVECTLVFEANLRLIQVCSL